MSPVSISHPAKSAGEAARQTPSLVGMAVAKLGGTTTLGVDVRSDVDLMRVVERGVRIAALDALVGDFLSPQEMERLIIPRRTLSHRRARNEPLSKVESERVVRVARTVALAEETFANRDKAHAWLRRPNPLLEGRPPLDLLDNEIGGRIVEELLHRIAHGIAA